MGWKNLLTELFIQKGNKNPSGCKVGGNVIKQVSQGAFFKKTF